VPGPWAWTLLSSLPWAGSQGNSFTEKMLSPFFCQKGISKEQNLSHNPTVVTQHKIQEKVEVEKEGREFIPY